MKRTIFRKNNCIVPLHTILLSRSYFKDHVYKIKENLKGVLCTFMDSKGSTSYGWHKMHFRNATVEETKLYELAGKPINIFMTAKQIEEEMVIDKMKKEIGLI